MKILIISGPGQKTLVRDSDSNDRTTREDSSKRHGQRSCPLLPWRFYTRTQRIRAQASQNLKACPCFRGVLKSPLSSFERCCQNDRRWSCDTALEHFTLISGGSFSTLHLISCKHKTSGFSYSRKSSPPFLIQARRPSTFHVVILKLCSLPSFDFLEQSKLRDSKSLEVLFNLGSEAPFSSVEARFFGGIVKIRFRETVIKIID